MLRRSDASSVIRVQVDTTGAAVTLPLTTSRILVDLGLVSTPGLTDIAGSGTAYVGSSDVSYALRAARDSGAGTLDWDIVYLVPADESLLMTTFSSAVSAYTFTDSATEVVAEFASALSPPTVTSGALITGDLPMKATPASVGLTPVLLVPGPLPVVKLAENGC